MTDPSASKTAPTEKRPKPGIFAGFRNSFFTGVVIALPIMATALGIYWIVTNVDGLIKPLLPAQYLPEWLFKVPGVGLIISVIALWMLGTLATNFFGRQILRLGESILNRVPFVSYIYKTVKQIVVTIAQQSERAFKDVCLIEYPRKGLYAIGFVTSDLRGAPAQVLPPGQVCVFVPTTPNPTSGFLLFVPRDEIIILDMTPEEGAKMIISGGMVVSNEELKQLERNSVSGET